MTVMCEYVTGRKRDIEARRLEEEELRLMAAAQPVLYMACLDFLMLALLAALQSWHLEYKERSFFSAHGFFLHAIHKFGARASAAALALLRRHAWQ